MLVIETASNNEARAMIVGDDGKAKNSEQNKPIVIINMATKREMTSI